MITPLYKQSASTASSHRPGLSRVDGKLHQHEMSQSSGSTGGASSSGRSIADADPVTRNALRYTISAREYQLLHQYLLSRTPVLRKRTLPPKNYEAVVIKDDDYNAATIRATARMFVALYSGLSLWDVVTERFMGRKVAHEYVICIRFKIPHLSFVSA